MIDNKMFELLTKDENLFTQLETDSKIWLGGPNMYIHSGTIHLTQNHRTSNHLPNEKSSSTV